MKTHLAVLTGLLALAALAQTGAPDPWTPADLIPPATLAASLNEGAKAPLVVYVGFPALYRQAHIPGAILAGPASKAEGLELLKAELAKFPKDRQVVLYCGCCPWDHCPNVRPAFKLIKDLGYKNAKLVTIPTNVHTDWTSKGYPVERPAN